MECNSLRVGLHMACIWIANLTEGGSIPSLPLVLFNLNYAAFYFLKAILKTRFYLLLLGLDLIKMITMTLFL
jgi:hypothetical protein